MVGISAYTEFAKLKNPVNDAEAIVQSLKDHGVPEEDIVDVYDCHIFTLNRKFEDFVKLCKPGDLAFLFYAGHGCAFGNHQCLLARALDHNERTLENNGQFQTILESSLQVDKILATLNDRDVKQHLLLLDCCREMRLDDKFRAGSDPLKEVEPAPFNISLGQGTTIGFATAPGDLASDGHRSENGHGEDFSTLSTTTHSFAQTPFHRSANPCGTATTFE